jgi:hypothetical protein
VISSNALTDGVPIVPEAPSLPLLALLAPHHLRVFGYSNLARLE